ncbi:MAG: 5-(carboxyamino)imidazole ribonucleotide synthase [Actinobacteria bacterium]|nr:MAG: 5-(carboxyamino)imidazole ribonucleotide synthase [Actinomycetota bacterium]
MSAPVVGMIGGGQLARMSAEAATALGIGFRVLAHSPTDPAAQVVRDVHIGSHEDIEALLAFAEGCEVVTFDHEHVPPAYLEQLEALGVAVRPGPAALFHAQDKIHMRQSLTDIGVRCPRWRVVSALDHLTEFAAEVNWPVVLKTSRGGYDGRGVWVIKSAEQAAEVLAIPLAAGAQWLVEEHIDFIQELSAQVARSPHGQAVAYPVARTTQINGICAEVVVPCPGLSAERAVQAQEIALRIARDLNVTGMLAVEMFDTGDKLFVNELAMRPHNSGHWSIEGAVTSQFENHLRAVLDLPLGDPRAVAPYAVMVNILGGDAGDLYSAYRHVLARDPGIKVHLYGKEVRPGRKLGHVTVIGDNHEQLLARGRHAADYFAGVIDE